MEADGSVERLPFDALETEDAVLPRPSALAATAAAPVSTPPMPPAPAAVAAAAAAAAFAGSSPPTYTVPSSLVLMMATTVGAGGLYGDCASAVASGPSPDCCFFAVPAGSGGVCASRSSLAASICDVAARCLSHLATPLHVPSPSSRRLHLPTPASQSSKNFSSTSQNSLDASRATSFLRLSEKRSSARANTARSSATSVVSRRSSPTETPVGLGAMYGTYGGETGAVTIALAIAPGTVAGAEGAEGADTAVPSLHHVPSSAPPARVAGRPHGGASRSGSSSASHPPGGTTLARSPLRSSLK